MTAYRAYWMKHPPVHLLAAAWLDYKPPTTLQTGSEPVSLTEIDE